MSSESKIVLGVILAIIGIAVVLILVGGNQTIGPADPNILVRSFSHMAGNKNAKVTIVEFGDYQCPACFYAHSIVKEVLNAYKDNNNVNFVFRNFPLSQHQNAMIAAEAAESAAAQGKFWEMHNMLYDNQNEWAESSKPIEFFVRYAQSLGLDIAAFKIALEKHTYLSQVQSDESDGVSLGINSTPTFFVNSEALPSTPSVEEFKKLIDAKLK
jgi:protein-disulfide isomerase